MSHQENVQFVFGIFDVFADAKDRDTHLCKGRYMFYQRCQLSLKDDISSFRDMHIFVKCIFHVFALPSFFNDIQIRFID